MEFWVIPAFWLILAIVLLIAEAATVSLVSVWFAAGALCAWVLSLLSFPFWAQVIAFLAVSLILFVLLKGKAIDYFRYRHDPADAPYVLGQEGIVTQAIDPAANAGRVKIAGQDWKASSEAPIAAGRKVRAVGLQGVTLQVTEVTELPKEKN